MWQIWMVTQHFTSLLHQGCVPWSSLYASDWDFMMLLLILRTVFEAFLKAVPFYSVSCFTVGIHLFYC